jgi:hypothetical protein
MSVFAGRHFFPDANHRTGRLVSERAALRACGMECSMPSKDAEAMVNASKDARRHAGMIKVRDLADARHPYRRVFSEHVRSLRCEVV